MLRSWPVEVIIRVTWATLESRSTAPFLSLNFDFSFALTQRQLDTHHERDMQLEMGKERRTDKALDIYGICHFISDDSINAASESSIYESCSLGGHRTM